jgi:Tfp pilus assembly protein PilW
MNRRAVRLERQTGWGLAEMMVGVMISMIAVLVIFESFSAFEAQKRTTTSAIAAQEAGLLALSAIERDARVAGYGLVVNNALACTTINIYQAGALAAIPAMPIAIADGGATASDSITFMYSTSSFAATPSALTIDAPTSTPVVMVGNTANNAAFTAGDFIMLAQPTMGKPCARLRADPPRQQRPEQSTERGQSISHRAERRVHRVDVGSIGRDQHGGNGEQHVFGVERQSCLHG